MGTNTSGSSPLMRGIQFFPLKRPIAFRIIPAHAGNTPYYAPVHFSVKDHPRSCGEYPSFQAIHPSYSGSSPLMRGIPSDQLFSFAPVRIIPAHAGNTWLHFNILSTFEDHPRSCGEYTKIFLYIKVSLSKYYLFLFNLV